MKPRKLSLYVHIPFCKAKCTYCDFLSFGGCGYDRQKQYVSALCREIEAYGNITEEYVVRTIFIGGGTPSYLEITLLEQIVQAIYEVFTVDEKVEITIEGNPDSLTEDKLIIYRRLGINRLSIGLQSTNDSLLKTLGRVHDYDRFITAYDSARRAGFTNINIDLMSGLPGEKKESYMETLEKVVKLQPEHISAYSLMVEEGTPLSEKEELLELLPSEEEDRQMYAATKRILKNSGYGRYEISNYAKPGFECRHNIVYWIGGEYLGLGLGAASYLTIGPGKKACEKVRFYGVENLDEYIEKFSKCQGMEVLEERNLWKEDEENILLNFLGNYYRDLYFSKRKDEMEEFMFLGLRMMVGISKTEFHNRFGIAVESVYGKVIDKYKKSGLLLEKEDRIFFSDQGIDVSNVVMAEFML